MKTIKLLLFSVIAVDFLGLNMTLTLLPSLILDPKLVFVPIHWNLQTRLFTIGLLTSIYPFGQFIGAAIWGKLSDHIGCKRALLIALKSTCGGYIISTISIFFHSVLFLFIGRLVTGFSAGNVAIVFAAMAGISGQDTKSGNFSLMQIAIGLGLLLGASFGGLLSDPNIVSWFNPVVPFVILIVAILINFILLYFILPNDQSKTQLTHLNKNPLQGIVNIIYYFRIKSLRMLLYTWSFFIAGMTLFGLMFPPFLAVKFHLNATSIGLLLTFWGCVYIISQILIIKPVSKRYNSGFLLYTFMIFPGITAISLMFQHHLYQLYIVIFFYTISLGFVMPNMFTVISDSVDYKQQGQILGVASSIQGLMTVIMTLLGGIFLAINSNLTVLIGGGLMLLAGLLYRYTL